jgi:hypothetical protein
MKRFIPALLLSLGVIASSNAIAAPKDATVMPDDTPIYHDIYITLKDKSPSAVQRQLELGKKYLANHPGELSFTATVLAHNLTRHKQVPYLFNEDNFDVAFHMVFSGRRAHDDYQVSDEHVKHFIPDSNPNWIKIRVFDSVER